MPKYGEKQFNVINRPLRRVDGEEKVTGRARYAADIQLSDMLYGGVLRSPYASARIVRLDTQKARAIPGVAAVVTAAELANPISFGSHLYLADHIYFQGNAVAMAAAPTRELLKQALDAIEVEFAEEEAVFTIDEALATGAHIVRPGREDNIFPGSLHRIRKGDVETGFAQADVIVERTYYTQHAEHAYIEPEAVVAILNPADGVMTVHSSSQNPYFTRRYVAGMLGVPVHKVRIVQETLGGTFGGKEEGVGLCAARAAYLARLTGRPVKIVNTREESILESAKRHPYRLTYRAGLTREGRIVAWQGTQIANAGAFSNQTPYLNWRANAHSAGAYDIKHVSTDTYGVHTNTFIGGAFRGFSSPQLIYAQEQFIDEIAGELGIDEVEFRKINCLKDGSLTATGTRVDHVLLEQIIDETAAETDYVKKRDTYRAQTSGRIRKGIGIAIAHRSCGFGAEAPDASGAMVIATEDGSITVNSGLAENGQGLKTVYCMIAAEALCVPYETVRFIAADTHSMPDCGMTVASRGTVMGAQPVKKAAERLNLLLRKNAMELGFFSDADKIERVCSLPQGTLETGPISADTLTISEARIFDPRYPAYRIELGDVCNSSLWTGKQLGVYEWFVPPLCPQDHETGQGVAGPTYAYGCVVAEVEVDLDTGYVDVVKVTASHDVGTAINPATIEGQIYGGVVMGQGYALMEDAEIIKGKAATLNLDEYLIPTALDMPEMKINLYECDDPAGTYGAKSVGEPATEIVAAAIANAVACATGRRIRENPAGLERVLLGRKLR